MAKRDYTKFSNHVEEETVEEVAEMFEPTETEEQHDEPIASKPKIGTVVDCTNLNIREKPSINANVVCTIINGTTVMVDESRSTEEFYKICTEIGEEGFCMKKYIRF